MSRESAQSFIRRMKDDEAFRCHIEATPRIDRSCIIQEEGYQFTLAELDVEASEVSPQDLETSVAGASGLCGLSPKFAY